MSSKQKTKYDNDLIKEIDKEMGWVEKDGSCPSKTADEQGHDCKFFEPWGTSWRCRETGLWSITVLNYEGLQTTLLAKSFEAVVNQLKKLHERVDRVWTKEKSKYGEQDFNFKHTLTCPALEKLQEEYHQRWERRYKRWASKFDVDRVFGPVAQRSRAVGS